MHLYCTLMACGDSRSADEKGPVNQTFLTILEKNGYMFQFPQNDNAGTDLL